MSGHTVRSVATVGPDTAEAQLEIARLINKLAEIEAYKSLFMKRLFGVIAWANAAVVADEHFAELPVRLDGLISWAKRLGIPLEDALSIYLEEGFHLFGGVPITLAIRRPRRVLGADGDIELITFLVLASGDHWPNLSAI
jgi:hypothetical protein